MYYREENSQKVKKEKNKKMEKGKGKIGVDVKELGAKTVAEAAARIVEKGKVKKDKGDGKQPDVRKVPTKTVAEAAAEIKARAKVKEAPQKPKTEIKTEIKDKVPQEKPKDPQTGNESMFIKTSPAHVKDIRAIAQSASLRPIESKLKTPSGKEVIVVRIDALSETLRKLKELKKVLGSNLPTAINRVELDPNGLVFEFYVKYGRGPIYVKRASRATGLVCKSASAKKKTTAGDMRNVHLVTIKISASKMAAPQVVKLWKVLKYSISGFKA